MPQDDPMEKLKESLKELPPAFARTEVEKLLPGVIACGTLKNLNTSKGGPGYFKRGAKVFYERDIFIEWLLERIIFIAPVES